MNQLNKKTPSFYCLLLLLFPFSLYSQKKIIYPKEFPKNLIGTKLCAEINTSGKMFGGSTAFLKLPVEIFISKDLGIYARYNPNEQFNEDKWGETQKIEVFNLWKTIPRMDEYGDLIGIEYHYKVPQCDWLNGTGHCITAFSIYDFYGSKYAPAGKNLSIHLSVPSYENAHFYTGYTNINNCGQLKSEHELQKEKEELLKIENQKIEQEKAHDEKTKIEINSALEQKEYFKALQLFSLLNYKDDRLLIKINEGWLPEKERYTNIYKAYTAEFNRVKKEYYTSEKDFYIKHAENIKSKKISINGKEAYLKRIASTTDQTAKIYRDNILNQDAYVYTKSNQKHLISPVSINGNYYVWRYDEERVTNLNIELLYDTVANTYVPLICFSKNDQLVGRYPIVNTTVFHTNYYPIPFPMEINVMYERVVNESGSRILEELFPQQILPLNSSESIALVGLNEIAYPEDDKRNDKYEALKNEFNIGIRHFGEYLNDQKIIVTKNFYNPSILYLVKKLYPNADTLVFVFGDYKKSLGNLGLHINYREWRYWSTNEPRARINSGARGGSFVPLTKGVVELIDNKFLVYDKSRNYREVAANLIVRESKFPLTDLSIDKLTLDSVFNLKSLDPLYEISYKEQFPIYYKQLEMGTDSETDYFYNDSLIIQLLPVYLNIDTELPNSSKSIYEPINNLELNLISYDSDIDKIANKYFLEMFNYFNFKNQQNSKNAVKSLTKANKYLESFKKIYFNSKEN